MPAPKATKVQLLQDLEAGLSPQEIADKYGYKLRSLWKAFYYRGIRQPHIFLGYKTLTPEQRQLVVGTLMGDGRLILKNGYHSALRVGHSIAQQELIEWKFDVLRDWVTPRGITTELKAGRYPFLFFTTFTHSEFDPYASLFYPQGKKVVTKDILSLIEPMGLAVWFMDDGSHMSKKKGLRLHTSGFSVEENNLIARWFKSRWGITVRVGKISGGYPVISIYGAESSKFIEIIRPWILPSMQYKILDR